MGLMASVRFSLKGISLLFFLLFFFGGGGGGGGGGEGGDCGAEIL